MTNARILARYRIACAASEIAGKAQALAVEQSVEMPPGAITDAYVLGEIVGRVEDIAGGDGDFRVAVSLSAETAGADAGQLLNMLFGNSSIHADVTLEDAELPPGLLAAFPGPASGINGLRRAAGAPERALTCAALKPQGLSPAALGAIAGRLAIGGVDLIKDDHGLAGQLYSPFEARVAACAAAIRKANAAMGGKTRYAPNLSGDLDEMRRQIRFAVDEGVDAALIEPMICGVPAFCALARENRGMAFIAHPAMAGAARISPALLMGKLFRLFGADAAVFPNHGGRFGYSPAQCLALAEAARGPLGEAAPIFPVPAGGMTLDRIPGILDFYGPDAIILVGGGLLAAGERLSEETAIFVNQVASHKFEDRSS